MASVVVSATASRDIRSLIDSHSLPSSTDQRVRASLEPLRQFPLLGSPLPGRWAGSRFILGPWRWMLVVYRCDEPLDRVEVLTIQDGRSARSAASSRERPRLRARDEAGSNGGWASVPGYDLVSAGLLDLKAGRRTVRAALVRSASKRIAALGFDVPTWPTSGATEDLYRLIVDEVGEGRAHGRYNALRRRLASFLSSAIATHAKAS